MYLYLFSCVIIAATIGSGAVLDVERQLCNKGGQNWITRGGAQFCYVNESVCGGIPVAQYGGGRAAPHCKLYGWLVLLPGVLKSEQNISHRWHTASLSSHLSAFLLVWPQNPNASAVIKLEFGLLVDGKVVDRMSGEELLENFKSNAYTKKTWRVPSGKHFLEFRLTTLQNDDYLNLTLPNTFISDVSRHA